MKAKLVIFMYAAEEELDDLETDPRFKLIFKLMAADAERAPPPPPPAYTFMAPAPTHVHGTHVHGDVPSVVEGGKKVRFRMAAARPLPPSDCATEQRGPHRG